MSNLPDPRQVLRPFKRQIYGPWHCEACGHMSQFGEVTGHINRIFCRNPNCRYERLVDKKEGVIREDDGTFWRWDADGNKYQVRGR